MKTILTDDWDLIINQKKLIHLPFKLNIDKILNDYFLQKVRSTKKLPSNHTIEGYLDFLTGIRKYFNFFLDRCLLYHNEKQQMNYLIENYDELLKMNSSDKANPGKESKRLWKKIKKSNNHNKNDLINHHSFRISSSSATATLNTKNETDSGQNFDQNSQSETSDSSNSSQQQAKIDANDFSAAFNEESKTSTDNLKAENTNDNNNVKLFNEKPIDFTKLYGAVHLLRLFTKLGQFLFYSDLNSERLIIINSYVYDFLRYLSKNMWLFDNESNTSYVDASTLIELNQ